MEGAGRLRPDVAVVDLSLAKDSGLGCLHSLTPLVHFDDGWGVEAFHSCAVTPWLFVGADIQYIDPARGGNE